MSKGPEGHLVVHIRSWYVAHNGLCIHQPRDFAMRPQLLVRLTNALRRTWRDHLPGHETITARGDQQASAHRPQPYPYRDQGNYQRRGIGTLVVHSSATNSYGFCRPLPSMSTFLQTTSIPHPGRREFEEMADTLPRKSHLAGTLHTVLV